MDARGGLEPLPDGEPDIQSVVAEPVSSPRIRDLDGAAGIEPANAWIKTTCLTAWLRPSGLLKGADWMPREDSNLN